MTTLTPAKIKITFERILIPIDFSDVSDRAVEYAKSIAKSANSQLLLIHVNEPNNPIAPPEAAWIDQTAILEREQEQLEQSAATLRSEGFRAEAISVTGALQDEIDSVVKHDRIDLIVLGTHSKSGLERFLFGSDAEAVLRNVPCPVPTLGPTVPAAKDQVWRPKDVACATTFDPDSAWIAAYAYAFARQFEAQFSLFHVLGSKDHSHNHSWGRFENAFKQHLPSDSQLNPFLQTFLTGDAPNTGIVDYAKKRGSDVIIMGAKTASALATHLGRGIAPRVFAEAPCPVMTLHQS